VAQIPSSRIDPMALAVVMWMNSMAAIKRDRNTPIEDKFMVA
jgi:hypothetical protein